MIKLFKDNKYRIAKARQKVEELKFIRSEYEDLVRELVPAEYIIRFSCDHQDYGFKIVHGDFYYYFDHDISRHVTSKKNLKTYIDSGIGELAQFMKRD